MSYKLLEQTFDKIPKKIIEAYMIENHILRITLDFKEGTALVYEPIRKEEKELFVHLWLNGELSTKKLRSQMKQIYRWTQYCLEDFLKMVTNHD